MLLWPLFQNSASPSAPPSLGTGHFLNSAGEAKGSVKNGPLDLGRYLRVNAHTVGCIRVYLADQHSQGCASLARGASLPSNRSLRRGARFRRTRRSMPDLGLPE